MANRVRPQTIKIRNEIFAELEDIYGSEWREISTDVDSLIDSMYLDNEEATQRERLKYAEKDGKKNKLIKLIVAAAVLSNTKAIKRINAGMNKIYLINANDVSKYIYLKSKIKIAEKGIDIKKLLDKHTIKRYNNATDKKYVSDQVLKEINRMLKAGDGTKKISKRLEKVYGFNKTSAKRTTLTETTRIQSRGRFDVMKEASKRGMVFKKIWRHGIHVAMPRDWHVEADGQAVDLDKPFLIDGVEMMHPGDSAGGAENNCNCHCWLDEELIDW